MRNTLLILVLIPAVSMPYPSAAFAQVSRPPTPCTASGVAAVDSTWRQVLASGFTFCVPGSWRPQGHGQDKLDAKDWTGLEGSITWDTGAPPSIAPPQRRGEITGTITYVSPGEQMPPPTPQPVPTPTGPEPCAQPTTTPHLAGNVVLFITQGSCEGTWTTTAWSAQPRIYVRGQVHSEKAAELLRLVTETVQVAAPTR